MMSMNQCNHGKFASLGYVEA